MPGWRRHFVRSLVHASSPSVQVRKRAQTAPIVFLHCRPGLGVMSHLQRNSSTTIDLVRIRCYPDVRIGRKQCAANVECRCVLHFMLSGVVEYVNGRWHTCQPKLYSYIQRRCNVNVCTKQQTLMLPLVIIRRRRIIHPQLMVIGSRGLSCFGFATLY